MKIFIITLSILLMGAGTACAGHRGGPPDGGPAAQFRKLTELDLSAAQKKDVAAILKQHRKTMTAGRDEARAAHEKIRAAMEADTFDEKAIRSAAAELSAQKENHLVERARFMSELKKILTPEQWNELRPADRQAEGKQGKRHDRMEQFMKKVDDWIAANS